MTAAEVSDVIVICAGPAGSTAATLIARGGHKVTVFEREKFPRDHVGVSLLPFCYQIFEELGILEEMKRTMTRKPGVCFIDTDGVTRTAWCYKAIIHDESYRSFHVRRDRFDWMLLRNAEKYGAVSHEETRVMDVDLERPDGLVEVTVAGPDGERSSHLARFVVDASGRDTVLANRFGTKRKNEKLDRSALWQHWKDVSYDDGFEEGLIQIVYLGGEKKGWIWMIPVGANRMSVGAVFGSDYYKAQRKRLVDAGSEDWKYDLYLEELDVAPFVQQHMANATAVSPLMVNGDYSYKSDVKYGKNFALVGDAHTFLDPIFSSGVYLSMNTARLVAKGLNPWLSGEDESPTSKLDEVYSNIVGAYQLIEKAILSFYNPTAINFAQAGSAADILHEQHQNALASLHYILAGDFFDRYEEYSKALDQLTDPVNFARYKNFVLDREGFVTTTCDEKFEDAFTEFQRGEVEPAPAIY